MSRHGIGAGTRVVLYSRDRVMWATRVWWMLHVMGFDDAAVLDGGFEKWQAEGRPVSTAPAAYPAARFVARPRPGLMVDKADGRGGAGGSRHAADQYAERGRLRRRGAVALRPPGHIPGSVNLPWPGLTLPESNLFIGLEEAADRLATLGAPAAERIVCYCGGGISATMGLFLLHRLGYDNLALYDASMAEWARDESLPIERGAAAPAAGHVG